MKFRSKPKEIDAEQWFPGKQVRGVHGVFEGMRHVLAAYPEGCYDIDGPSVVTVHRQVTPIAPGDWIIAESDGIHHYSCKPEIFKASYKATLIFRGSRSRLFKRLQLLLFERSIAWLENHPRRRRPKASP